MKICYNFTKLKRRSSTAVYIILRRICTLKIKEYNIQVQDLHVYLHVVLKQHFPSEL